MNFFRFNFTDIIFIKIFMILLYTSIFIYLIYYPFYVDFPISSKNVGQIDGPFYFKSKEILFNNFNILLQIYKNLLIGNDIEIYREYFPDNEFIMPGPIFPSLIYIFNYSEINYL